MEAVAARTGTVWRDMLGEAEFQLAERIALAQSESADAAATRLWTARECLKKIGQSAKSPLVLEAGTEDGWTQLRAGATTIMTWVAAVRGLNSPLVLSVAFAPVTKAGQ
jgi:enediyne polyketide synthase